MIDNFDHLVARCVAKRRRVMIRRFLFITGTILFIIALIAGYLEIFPTSTTPNAPTPSLVHVPNAKVVTPPIDQHPIALPKTAKINEIASQQKKGAISPKNESKTPLYVLQLTSSTSYNQVKALLQKTPKEYQSGMGIYLVNHYYTLRYVTIYDASHIVPLITKFKQLGFEKPILFKYNPNRIPLTDTMAALIVSSQSTIPPQAVQNATPTVALQPLPPSRTTGAIFSVTSSPKVQDSNPLATFKQNPTYELAITIARDFYGKNNFVDAAIWAKKANQLNREQEEAWLLYAQSYWGQGRKKEAVEVLELYMNYKDSKAASELYRTWKSSNSN